MIGALVTVNTAGWDKFMRNKCKNQVGVVMRIDVEPGYDYPIYLVNFGTIETKVTAPRIKLLTKEKE